jgi:hypothetical protein
MKNARRPIVSHAVRCLVLALTGVAAAQTIDVVGGASNLANTSSVAKGNSYEITTSVTLTKAEFELDFTGPQTLTFTVHSGPVEFGTYTQIYQSSAIVSGAGNTWYSSPALNVPLVAGLHYIVAVSWDGNMNYFFDVADTVPVSFGSYTHGYAVGANPLPSQFDSLVNDGAVYFQRLTTQPPGPVITNFCTAGTTSNGCVASITGTGTPSASSGSGFTIQVSSVEGQKQGILFYGIDNNGFAPTTWGQSSSFLCVKHPSQRTGVQNSGGTFAQCDGSLALDWNAYIATHASALGNPFAAGQHVFAQAWFRDPPSPKSTMLSNALEFSVAP